MKILRHSKRAASILLLLGSTVGLSACGGMSSPLDNAMYMGGGDHFGLQGYSRTIFSSNNF